MQQRATQRRRNRPGAGPDFDDPPLVVVAHDHPARVAGQAPRRFRGNVAPFFQRGLAGLRRIREHRRVDVDHDLVALARDARVDRVMERRLREQGQRVGLLLGPGRRRQGGIGRGRAGRGARPLVQRLARGVERSHEQGADLGSQPAANDDRAVLARAPDGQQPRLGLGRGHAGQGADLGVGELAAGQRLGQARQRVERAGDADPLAGGAQVEADAPAEPGGAGGEAGVPAAAGVELADEGEQPGGRGVEVRGQLGDLVAQAVQVGERMLRGGDGLRGDRHGEPSFSGRTLHLECWEAGERPRSASVRGGVIFQCRVAERAPRRRRARSARRFPRAVARAAALGAESVKRKVSRLLAPPVADARLTQPRRAGR